MATAVNIPVQSLAPPPGAAPFQANAARLGGSPQQRLLQQSSDGQFSGAFQAAQDTAAPSEVGRPLAAGANTRSGSTMGLAATPQDQILAGLAANPLKLTPAAGLNFSALAEPEIDVKSGANAKAAMNQALVTAGKTAGRGQGQSTAHMKTAKPSPAATGPAQGSTANQAAMTTQTLAAPIFERIVSRTANSPQLARGAAAGSTPASLPVAADAQRRIPIGSALPLTPKTAEPAKAAEQRTIAAGVLLLPARGAAQEGIGAAAKIDTGAPGKMQSTASQQAPAQPSPAQPAQPSTAKSAGADTPAESKAGVECPSGPAPEREIHQENGKASVPGGAGTPGTAKDPAAGRGVAAERAIPASPAVPPQTAAAVPSNLHGPGSAPAGLPLAPAGSTATGNASSNTATTATNPHALLDSGGAGGLAGHDAQWQLSPNRVEAGFASSQNSWVSVVAQRQDGHLTAALASESLSGKEALQSLLPQLSQHLAQRQVPVSQLGVSVSQQFSPGAGSGGSGNRQGGHSEPGSARLPQSRPPLPSAEFAPAGPAGAAPAPAPGRRISLRV